MDQETKHFVLVMEDLKDAQSRDQVMGSTPELTHKAVMALAKLHAKYWGKVDGPDLDWMMDFRNQDMASMVTMSYTAGLPLVLKQLPDSFPGDTLKIAEDLGPKINKIMQDPTDGPRTVVHGDFRTDNLMFGQKPGAPELTVVDWQISGRGLGAFDVGYHTSQSLPVEVRRKIEKDLLKDYHKALLDNGVEGYPFDDCWEHYRISILFGLVYPVIACGGLDLSNERGKVLGQMMLDRSISAIQDLNAGDMLSMFD